MSLPHTATEGSRRSLWGTPNTAGVSIPHELSFKNIGHSFDGNSILSDITLAASSGSVTCLLGPSGSGKTTLLRIAAGMERQTTGSVYLDGVEIGGPNIFIPPEKRGIGLVFQDYALFPHLNILDNVLFGLTHLPRDARQQQAHKMLTRVGLDDRRNDFPHQLSGGEQQRVALARAMAPRPGVLLMDEPFSGLDSRLRDTVREETLGVLRETHATAIIVTHDPEEALRMGDQIALLHRGKLEQLGTGRDLYFRPKSLFAAGFFSELNYFDGKVKDGKVDTPLGPVPINGARQGQAATAAFRVNSINVTSANNKVDGVKGRILSVHFTGDHVYLRIGISGSEQAIRARARNGELKTAALVGGADVMLSPSLEGSFAFPIEHTP
ncbi:MAG: ABC transporter ATP-binding protein [Rhizobiaceae bacterium]